MPAAPRDDLRRLHFINALFARLTSHDLYLAQQIQSAIAFSLGELADRVRADPTEAARYDAEFTAAAARLLDRFFTGQRGGGFFHWDALNSPTSALPLFARAELMTGLKRLTPYPSATLLITNLRPAFLPPSQRATPRRTRAYTDAITYAQDLIAARTAQSAQMQVLFL
jgi:hypothetical protein